MRRVFKWSGMALAAAAGLLAVFVLTRSPSHERDWIPMHERVAKVEISGDLVRVRNLRDFSYSGADAVAAVRWRDVVYDSSEIESVWYGLSHFDGNGFAHPFLSFVFSDGRTLVLSIEARLEKGETYGPIAGFVRAYERIYVLGTERDVIGLRSHWRGERVLLYELQLDRRAARNLLGALMRDVQAVEAEPSFYNTLFGNCLTSLLRHAHDVGFFKRVTDYRILLPGYSDALAYEMGLLDTSVPLEDLRARAQVDAALAGVDDPDFSRRIRGR